ncbi:MAG: hypothetical protein ACTSPB_21125 [Candidatus Thorarchaeota archaeon]
MSDVTGWISLSEFSEYWKVGFLTAYGLTTQQWLLLLYFLIVTFQWKLAGVEKMLYANVMNSLICIGFAYWRWGADALGTISLIGLFLIIDLLLLLGFFRKIVRGV